jgi:hypothetical protein
VYPILSSLSHDDDLFAISLDINISKSGEDQLATVALKLQGLNIDIYRYTLVRLIQFAGKINQQFIESFDEQYEELITIFNIIYSLI